MVEVAGQTTGTCGATGAAITKYTDWSNIETQTSMSNFDSTDNEADGKIDRGNTEYYNMDGTLQSQAGCNAASYYAAIFPRPGADVVDMGAYTIQFQLTKAGNVISTQTVKIDFVSAAAKSDAKLTITQSGTFLRLAALGTTDTAGNTFAFLTLKNRDDGVVRTNTGDAPAPTVSIQQSRYATPAWSDTGTLFASDTGTINYDKGVHGAGGSGTLRPQDGIYGLFTSVLPSLATDEDAGEEQLYRFRAIYGNSGTVTSDLVLFDPSGAGGASAGDTDVLVTATGMSAADQLKILDNTAKTWTLPVTTTSATVKFFIVTSSETASPAAKITVTPTWSGAHGTASVTPATSTTGTVYTTDASGNFSVTVTNSAPVAGATLALKLTGGAAFGTGSYTATLKWAAPAATTLSVVDPLDGVYVKTGTTNVTTVMVKDQFGNPMANESVSVSLGLTSANYSATTTIAPIKTGASGTATYSLVGGATTGTKDVITFACVPTACSSSPTMTYNYVSTVPAVATLDAYYNYDWNSAAAVTGTLWPATGKLYKTGTTDALLLEKDINTSKSMSTAFADGSDDAAVSLALKALTSAGASATGAVVTVSAATGGHILDASGLPVRSRDFLVGSTGWTGDIQILATKSGDITFTATSGSVSRTVTIVADNANTDARFITITSAAAGTANGAGVPVTVSVTDRFGNPVAAVKLVVRASGVGALVGGNTSTSFETDAEGTYTFLATSFESAGGVGTFTASSSTTADFSSAAGYSGATEIDSTVAAGNSSKSVNITFAAGQNSAQVAAEAATDAALEAIDAANAATDAANLAAEAADAATVAAEEARDAADAATAAVEALASEVATLISGLKAQITTLANTVAKIAKKVKA